MRNCLIQNYYSEQIANFILGYVKKKNISVYNEENGKGLLRHIVIKVGVRTHEIMCILVINGKISRSKNSCKKHKYEKYKCYFRKSK